MGIWDAFSKVVDARPEPQLRAVPGLATNLPPHDDDFVATLDPIADADIDGVAIGIAYRDASGIPSVRTIRCHAAYRDGQLIYIQAWCLVRQDWRTFRLDRIQEVFDYTTGEFLGPANVFFGELLNIDLLTPVDEARARRLFRDGAKVLLFIALEDGHLHDSELGIVMDYALGRLRNGAPQLRFPEQVARRWIGNYVPSRQSALAGLRAIFDDEEHIRDVASRMIDIMLADGTVTDEEMDAACAIVRGMERAEKRKMERGE